jgi:hypothetical protein
MAQLKIAVGSTGLAWSDDLEKAIQKIRLSQPDPCP